MKYALVFIICLHTYCFVLAQSPREAFSQKLADCYSRNDQTCVAKAMKEYVNVLKSEVGTEHEEYQGAVLLLAMHLIDNDMAAESPPYIHEIIALTTSAKGADSEEVQGFGMLFLSLLDSKKAVNEKTQLQKWLSEQFPDFPPTYWGVPPVENTNSYSTEPLKIDVNDNQSIDQLLALLENSYQGISMDTDGATQVFKQLIPLEEKIIEKMEKELKGRHDRYVEILFLTANSYTYIVVNSEDAKEREICLAKSNALIDRALAVTEKSAGKQNEDYLIMLNAKAANFAVTDQMDKYVGVLEEMLAIMKGYLPKDDEMYQQTLQMYALLGTAYGNKTKTTDIISAMNDLSPELKDEMPISPDMLLYAKEQTEVQDRAKAVIPKMNFPNLLDTFLLFPQSRKTSKVNSFLDASYQRLDPSIFSKLDDDASRVAMAFLQQEFETLASFVLNTQTEFPQFKTNLLKHALQLSYLDHIRKERLRQRLLLKKHPKYKQLYSDWAIQKGKINKLYEGVINGEETKKIEITPEENRLKELEKQLAQAVDKTYVAPKPILWENIQTLLKPDEAFVEIRRFIHRANGKWTSQPVYMALIFHADSKEPDVAFLKNAKELDYEFYLQYQNSRFYGDDGKLYQAYFAPIRQYLKGAKKVYLAPDGVFHKINLNTLKIPGGKKNLIDEVDIQLVGSMLTLAQEKTAESGISSALLIGDPLFDQEEEEDEGAYFRSAGDQAVFSEMKWKSLPWSAIEIRKIDSLLQKKGVGTHSFLKDKAQKQRLAEHPGASIIHLATHAWFSPVMDRMPIVGNIPMPQSEDDEYPAMSGLLLDKAWEYVDYDSVHWDEQTIEKLRSMDKNIWSDPKLFTPDLNSGIVFSGGMLTSYEIYGLDMQNTQLVVLSACNSGVSDLANGRGVAGLRGAFEMAGANYIINTLWEVKDDVAQAFMLFFYDNWLNKGQSIGMAFRNAQLQIREEVAKKYPDHSRADLWGAFVLIDL